MATWRRKALALFPMWKKEIEQNFSLYDFWSDFLSLTHEAHLQNDFEFLEKIYGLAEWCINATSKVLYNAAGVSFYEHLLSIKKEMWSEILPWLSDDVVYKYQIKDLWQCMLGEDENIYLEIMLKNRNEPHSLLKFSHSNVYTNGTIHRL